MLKNKKFIIGLAAGVVIVLAILFYSGVIKFDVPLAPYSSPAFGISFEYPEQWVADVQGGSYEGVPLRFVGSDGYFGLDALPAADDNGAELTLDNLATRMVQPYQTSDGKTIVPYGKSPTIKSTVIDGAEARVILPSDDQSESARHEAIFVARYPEEIKISENFFRFLIIYAQKDYLENILRTLHFSVLQKDAEKIPVK